MATHVANAERDVVMRRRPQPTESLAPETIAWLAAFPVNVRPRLLPVQFVRIANALCRAWRVRAKCLAYLDDLLIDSRGTRGGFPLGVALELARLKDYFETVVFPTPQSVWDEVSARRRGGA